MDFAGTPIRSVCFVATGYPFMIAINCWNEWTEGSSLEPDAVHGMGYLDAVRAVFGKP